VQGSVSALFINSGNRPISVIGATVVFGEPSTEEGHTTCKGVTLDTDLAFIVIDEKKIIETKATVLIPSAIQTKVVDKREPDFKEQDGHISFVAPDFFRKGNVATCIVFHYVTPRVQGRSTIETHTNVFSFERRLNYSGVAKTFGSTPVLIYRSQNMTFL